jgi:membrane protein YfhO
MAGTPRIDLAPDGGETYSSTARSSSNFVNSRNHTRAEASTTGVPVSRRFHGWLAVGVMLLGVAALYRPWLVLVGDRTLVGFDYFQLHLHRIRYAREALFSAHPYLPAWYSRELLGTPFWSNIQSFPFIPTRLLLLLVDPLKAYALAVNLAAGLAAVFTYLYCRQIGFTCVAAASSGWTFAASGFFASRVMVGHLPLLEAYPALPLLLWLVEKIVREPSRNHQCDLRLLTLSLTCGFIAMAGHPQLPAYAFATTVLYLLYRARNRQALKFLCAIVLGIGLAGFVLWPALHLIGRSTRFLPLDAPQNDISFPYQRLAAYIFPWKDGFPSTFSPTLPFTSYPNAAYFWDTVCYVGWLPLLAVIFLLLRGKSRITPWPFFVALGSLALILALPAAQSIRSLIPGTILRSPSRQIYLTTFALALAFGGALDSWLREPLLRGRILTLTLAILMLAAHVVDLGLHDLRFIHVFTASSLDSRNIDETMRTQIGDGRIALDLTIMSPFNREIDDVGFFDSVMLTRPYRALLDLAGASPTINTEKLNGSQISAHALAATATKMVVTFNQRDDLPRAGGDDFVHIYAVPSPIPRASFLAFSQASFLGNKEIHERLRDPSLNLAESIMLPSDAEKPSPTSPTDPHLDSSVTYERPSSDMIVLKVKNNQSGFLRVIESFDPGWRATVDGTAARVLPADDFTLAVRLDPGIHEVRFQYHTPGVVTGAAISAISLLLLVLLVFYQRPVRL